MVDRGIYLSGGSWLGLTMKSNAELYRQLKGAVRKQLCYLF